MATYPNIETMWVPKKKHDRCSPEKAKKARKKEEKKQQKNMRNLLAALSFETLPKRKRRKATPRNGSIAHGTRVDSSDSSVYFDAAEYSKDLSLDSMVLAGVTVETTPGAFETVLDGIISSDSETSSDESTDGFVAPCKSPRPPDELPLRFLRAGKNDKVEGLRRYHATLKMRREQNIDEILREPSPHFALIKQHYPHFCHLRGKSGEPCFYEQPPKTNLKALRAGGVNLQTLLRHYTMITEYQWQYLERDDSAKSIYIIDLQGIRMTDFMGEAVDFVKRAAGFSSQHYPERGGCIFVINVPGWFNMIWQVVKPIVDEETLKKVYILRGKDAIRKAMLERIDLENIPPEYGGKSMPLGESPEEKKLAELVEHNNKFAKLGECPNGGEHCKFCRWQPARSY